jgi:uncharacterized protein
MICPACRQQMIVVEYKQIELDFCLNCHGAWFDNGELELLLESAAVKDAASIIRSILDAPAAESSERKRKCPICGKKMQKTVLENKTGVLLDVCIKGDGLWFDGGEVDQFVNIAEGKTLGKNGHDQVLSFLQEVFKAPTR